MKRTFLSILFCITVLSLYAANDGGTCRTAIPLTKDDFSETITKVGTEKWYSAQTFDLPLSVAFVPDGGESAPAPVVEMDFSCTSGYYEDSILCSLFCKTSGNSSLQGNLPYVQTLEKGKKDGKFAYTLSLGKRYRDLLLQMGISYNLTVYVKVTYNSTGILTMLPDAFTDCMDGPKFMHFGDTVRVAAKDKDRHVIVPYVQWQEDTVVYTWNGTKPCRLGVAYICDFDPTDDHKYGDIMVQSPDIQPGTSVKAQAQYISEWVHNDKFPPQAGMYFAKFYSEEPGVMKITKAPQAPPKDNATLLRLDRTYALNANETGIFAIAKSWDNDTLNTRFATPTEHLFSMYIATAPDFSEEHMLKQYQFEKYDKGHWQGIFGSEMHGLWAKAIDQYLYIRFECSEATTITPSKWTASTCVKNTKDFIHDLDTTFRVLRATSVRYRLLYSQWIGGDLTVTFTPKNKCTILFATDCNISLEKTDPNILYATDLTSANNSVTIPAETIASWAKRVDEEGYIYARFNHTLSGTFKITLKSEAQPEKDPEYPKSTVFVSCEASDPYFEVSEAQTVVVKDANNTPVNNVSAEPKAKYSLSDLPAGKYTLEGKTEKIEINL